MIFKNPKILFPAFMAFFMALIISCAMTIANRGFVADFFLLWMKNFGIGFMIAFPTAFFVSPVVQKIVANICKK